MRCNSFITYIQETLSSLSVVYDVMSHKQLTCLFSLVIGASRLSYEQLSAFIANVNGLCT